MSLDALHALLGDRLETTPAALEAARTDKSGHVSPSVPLGIVHAESVSDVQETLRWASATGTPVVTRGAGTGLAGGAVAGPGELVLSTLRMDAVLEINEEDLLAVVEPGILNGAFNALLAEHGLWFAPDPASKEISTVGGNIATNAGGLLCAKYGVTRDAVLALDVVLADGTLMAFGHRSVKGVTGFDLTGLMVGSEGLLGVIVGATVRLRRRVAGETCTIAAYFPSVRLAAEASAAVTAAGLQPSIMELMDGTSLAAAHRLLGLPETAPGESHLVIQTDGPAARAEAEAMLAVLLSLGGRAELCVDEAEGDRLLAVRRSMHPAMESLGNPLIEDVSVPRSRLAEMFDAIADIERRYGIQIPTVAHAGDGNLHPNLLVPGAPGDPVPDLLWEAAHEMFQASLRLGGTLTGEHGIGLLKKRWLAEELGEAQFALQRRVKAAFDPQNLLNPGKVYE